MATSCLHCTPCRRASAVRAALLLLACGTAAAQGIERRNEPYRAPMVLPTPTPATPSAAATLAPGAPGALPLAPSTAAVGFDISPADRSIREALARWARSAGWSHEPSHWTLDRDFPVEGAAGAELFGPDFKTAVRLLLASTELTERPVQPCFYSNRVVRVIPQAELCNKAAD